LKNGANGRPQHNTLPGFALSVHKLRETCALTQPKLAAELGVRRGAVARWEAGTREPNMENYSALAAFAEKRGSPAARFFAERIQARKAESKEKGRRTQALRDLEMEEYLAGGGDEESQRLLELSRLDPVTYSRQWNQRSEEARKNLENGAFAVKLRELTYEAAKVDALRTGRNLRIKRTFELLSRQTQVESIQREKIKEILVEAKAGIDQGRPIDLVRVVDRIVSMVSLRPRGAKRRAGREGIEVGGINLKPVDQILEKMVIAEGRGKPLHAANVVRELEQAFGLKTDTAEVKE
jgi:DNA-binding XRE family transcriptional regulator